MDFQLIPLSDELLPQFKKDMQEAFQRSAEDTYGPGPEILPESHIDRSLNAEGAAAYAAIVDGEMVGGAIIAVDRDTAEGGLSFLYVKHGVQSKGIGKAIWSAIENLHPEVKVWMTCTPYFEKRNIHFYVNCCGFHIVRFYHKGYPDPNDPEDYGEEDEAFAGMFVFQKVL